MPPALLLGAESGGVLFGVIGIWIEAIGPSGREGTLAVVVEYG